MSYRRSNPHSFPTRRSSDLNIKPKGDSFVLSDKVVIKFPGTKAVLRGAEQNRELLVPVNFAGTSSSRFCSAPRRTDRKSTRLNSSHGYISYAVFCLNKKNTRIRHVHRRSDDDRLRSRQRRRRDARDFDAEGGRAFDYRPLLGRFELHPENIVCVRAV